MRKLCRHGAGKTGAAQTKAWRRCDCAWYADLRVGAGRRVRVNLGTDERIARIEHARLVLERERGTLHAVPGNTIEAFANRWLAELEAAPGARVNTLIAARSRVAHILRWFGRAPVQHVTGKEIESFLAELGQGRSPSTVANVWSALRAILRLAVREGAIPAIPDPGRVHQSPPREHRITLETAEEVVRALEPEWRDAGELVLLTGLRIGEVRGLVADDADLSVGVLRIGRTAVPRGQNAPKSRAGLRVVPLSPRAAEILARRVEGHPEGRLWPGEARDAGDAIRAALKAAGAYVTGRGWHTLRNVHVAMLEASGVSLREAAARVGHGANAAMTLRYGWAAEVGEAGMLDELRHERASGTQSSGASPPASPGETPGP